MADPQTWQASEWSSLARWTTWVLRTSRWTVVATLDAGPGWTGVGTWPPFLANYLALKNSLWRRPLKLLI